MSSTKHSAPAEPTLYIAVIGDIHGAWSIADVDHFNHSHHHALLFVGDLPNRLAHHRDATIARQLAALRKPAVFIPGNHDAVHLSHFLAELFGWRSLASIIGRNQRSRLDRLRQALHPIQLGGYSHHTVQGAETPRVGVICARPHAQGGGLNFAPLLRDQFGIHSLEESAARLCAQIDDSPHQRLIFLAHNGPKGLGGKTDSIWGCDFKPTGGDWGDDDLRAAIDHARHQGRDVLAVIGGHMHHRTRQGTQRPWLVMDEGTCFINAARVPRIEWHDGRRSRFHITLSITPTRHWAEACWVEET